jgi:pyridoxamine 5'-phosphate oxidase
MAEYDVSSLRRDYGKKGLHLSDLAPDPMVQFKQWLDEAVDARLVDPNAMSLATASAVGETTIRTVLLKGYSEEGFLFFTNAGSTKATQIAENPHVSLLFAWLPLERQVIINGAATRVSMAESARYFLARPRESRIASWVSPQSRIIDAKHALEAKFEEMLAKFAHGEVPVPEFWAGYRVRPRMIEFWQGGKHRLHDRFQYRRVEGGWAIVQLGP